ncbi:hypothetical protein CIHG_10579 [Coccidioides immitis H538.4]|uniref:Uncharacterized protein n=1 Tax=Coccidioides immitis H538.4 TaxID=396776 RepID=A0A0P6Q2Y4_COCIT|nr:hypothetical protein CIHG_10579 [Coccidioides immitis H538.4]
MEDSSLVVRRATYVETYRFLVVVGDQSSAESPVLEGLTRQPRLRENGLSSIKELNPVENAMGIGDVGDTGKKPFSEDIRIEVYGPNQEHFSVTDLPNISRRTTAGVSTKDVFEWAGEFNPDGNRTLEELTGPDLVDK